MKIITNDLNKTSPKREAADSALVVFFVNCPFSKSPSTNELA